MTTLMGMRTLKRIKEKLLKPESHINGSDIKKNTSSVKKDAVHPNEPKGYAGKETKQRLRAWLSVRRFVKRPAAVVICTVTALMLAATLIWPQAAARTAGAPAEKATVMGAVMAQRMAIRADILQSLMPAPIADEQTAAEEPAETPRVLADMDTGNPSVQDDYASTSVTLAQEDSAALEATAPSVVSETVDMEAVPAPAMEPGEVLKSTVAMTSDEVVEDFVEDADVYYDDIGYSTNGYDYNDDELYLLVQIIDIESRGEPFEGMVAVGNVVMNRVLNPNEFGNTIPKVVKSGQFAYSGNSRRVPSKAAWEAAQAVLDDEYWVIAQDVYFFRSGVRSGKDWKTRPYAATIGGHCFYTYDYSGRYTGGSIPPPLYERTYRYAQYGCTPGERVWRIEEMLLQMGYDVSVDGLFDRQTKVALMAFQEQNGLKPSGIAEPATVKALIKAFGFNHYNEQFLTQP